MDIRIYNVNKTFGNTKILNDISLTIPAGKITALLGPSGSGKTTLLRIIAGLEIQNSGRLFFQEQEVTYLHSRDRKVGFVFQNYALFRHMTVLDNVSFGLNVQPRTLRPSAQHIRTKAMHLLEMVQLEHFADRYPAQLSGGQKQRVALARALAVEPKILLLDEPFGALDLQVRKELRRWLRCLHEELNFTSVFVTHDQEEAMELANEVVIMRQGSIEQIGTPKAIWDEPASQFVLEFLGEVNCISGEIKDTELCVGAYCWPLSFIPSVQGSISLYLRPWELEISAIQNKICQLPVTVEEIIPHGYYLQLVVKPIAWGQSKLNIILTNKTLFHPVRGEQYFVGSINARIYKEGQVVAPISLAMTA